MPKEVAVRMPENILAKRQGEPTTGIAAPDTRGDRQGTLTGKITEVFKVPSLDGIDNAQVNSLFTKVADKGKAPGRGSVADECTFGYCTSDGEKC